MARLMSESDVADDDELMWHIRVVAGLTLVGLLARRRRSETSWV